MGETRVLCQQKLDQHDEAEIYYESAQQCISCDVSPLLLDTVQCDHMESTIYWTQCHLSPRFTPAFFHFGFHLQSNGDHLYMKLRILLSKMFSFFF